jgi:hypothetical protein
MHTLFRIGFIISATTIALSGEAMAQAAYNGTYAGVSGAVSNSHCEAAQTPGR